MADRELTDKERSVIIHALGLTPRGGRRQFGCRWAYRNYFCAGEKDEAVWDKLVARGLAFKSGRPKSAGMPYSVYGVTRLGVELIGARNHVPHRFTSPKKKKDD